MGKLKIVTKETRRSDFYVNKNDIIYNLNDLNNLSCKNLKEYIKKYNLRLIKKDEINKLKIDSVIDVNIWSNTDYRIHISIGEEQDKILSNHKTKDVFYDRDEHKTRYLLLVENK